MIFKLFYFDKNKQKIIQKLENLGKFFWEVEVGFFVRYLREWNFNILDGRFQKHY